MKLEFSPFRKPTTGVLVVFCDDALNFGAQTRRILGDAADAVASAAASEHFTGKSGTALDLVLPADLKVARLSVIGCGKTAELKAKDFLKLGGAAAGKAPSIGGDVTVVADLPDAAMGPEAVADLAAGAKLRAYVFDRYKTKRKEGEERRRALNLTIAVANPAAAGRAWAERAGTADGVVLARDLINEPANVLYPVEFARRAAALRKLGVAVDVLDVRAMKRLGMGALLAVGQGSVHESRTVIMRWNGGKRGAAPVAFIGKGVCFDTGGISIKQAAGMEDMKGDMAGAACVVGLMHALAARKAKVNAIGAIGIVENMPDGNAYRPGDILTTMSGQTIEIINTDAEGRLVLADVLHYVNTKFKPRFMIDLATLTGAIMVALGQEYAGLFANNDELAASPCCRRRSDRGAGLAHAARSRIRQDDRLEIRRYEEHGRAARRLHYGGAVAGALRWQDRMGASRHRRHRARIAPERNQQELELGLGRAPARSSGGGALRGLTPS